MGSASEGAPVLRLSGVTVRYGNRVVLDLPEFAVAAGEVVAIMGPNGAGKSTLLHVAALLRRPQTGEVWITGERAGADGVNDKQRGPTSIVSTPSGVIKP